MKKIYFLGTLFLLAICFLACDSKYTTIDNNAYVTQAESTNTQILIVGSQGASSKLTFSMANFEDKDVFISYSVSADELVRYNKANGTDYQLLPSEYYTIEKSPKSGLIPRGKTLTDIDWIQIKPFDATFPDAKYALAITITNASGVRINQYSKTLFLTFKKE